VGSSREENEAFEDRLLDFGMRCGKVVDALPQTRLGNHIAGQLVRSSTSPAPNYAEACAAESRADFVHKLGIGLKELRESRVWLKACMKSELLPAPRLLPLTDECTQLMNIVGEIHRHRQIQRPKKTKTQKPTPKSQTLTPHFALNTFHFPLSTFHFALSTFHFPLCTLHFPLCTLHFPLSTLHFALCTLHFALCTLH
jgi:four helix bundle protein